MGSTVTTFFAVSMLALKGIAVPFSSSSASVRMFLRAVAVKSVAEASDLIASANVSVMFVPALVVVSPSSGSNVGASGAVVPTVKVALVAVPWLPCASQWLLETAT